MPSPVLALPWGSRSMIRTRFSQAARAVARFTAVVVLPTPPFWLAIARTLQWPAAVPMSWLLPCTPNLPDTENAPCGIRSAWKALHLHLPEFARRGQFFFRGRPFEKQGFSVMPQKFLCITQQFIQRRAGA